MVVCDVSLTLSKNLTTEFYAQRTPVSNCANFDFLVEARISQSDFQPFSFFARNRLDGDAAH